MSHTFQQCTTMSSSNVRPVFSTYCFEESPTFQEQIPRLPSDYLLNTGLNQTEIEQERQIVENRLHRTPSSYCRDDLNKANEPEIIVRCRVSGLPVRGAQLRELAASLGNQIYTPTLIDGRLYYVENEEAALEAARGVNSSDQPEEGVNTCRTIGSRIFTNFLGFSVPIDILERVLPQETMRSLARELMTEVLNGRFTLGEQGAFALARLAEGTGPSQSTATAAPFSSGSGLITVENPSATWLQMTSYDSDADLHTAQTLSNIHTTRSAARSSSVHTACSRSGFHTDGRGEIRSIPRTPSQPSARTARSASRTSVNTAQSNSNLQTARSACRTPINTARSISDFRKISFAPPTSPCMRTARTSSNASASRSSRSISQSPSQNVHGRLSSDSSVKAARLTSRSPSIKTARSLASTPVNTARTRSNSSVCTGRTSSIPDALTVPVDVQIVTSTTVILHPAQAEDSVQEIVNPSQLVRTPSSDKRAAVAMCSDVRTARSNNECYRN